MNRVPPTRSQIPFSPRRSFLLLLALFALSFAVGCGKRRPPLPPIERIPQRTELLSGVQRGNEVILSWPAPRRNAPPESVQSIRRIDIYRLAEPINAPLPLTEEEFAARSTLIGSLDYATISHAGDTLTYTDTLELTEPVRLRYAVRYVNDAGQRAAFSNFLLIEPAAHVSQPPVITGITPSETQLTVHWQPPAANVDQTTPANILGYNIYRTTSAQNEPAETPLNPTPITTTEYADRNFRFGDEYTYVVRAVSLGTGGAQVESLNSNAESLTPRDIYPPSAPAKPTIAVAPDRLSIFFAANPEPDVAGYNLYRSTDPTLPKPWTKLNSTLLTRTTYQDVDVQPGIKYYYYLEAVDTAGNISPPSEVASETVPQ